MAKTPKTNRWQEHHNYLVSLNLQAKPMAEIKRLCGWSDRTFYRKLENPGSLSIAEKTTVSNVYTMPAHFLFPEMEYESTC